MLQNCDGCNALTEKVKTMENDCISINTRLSRVEHSHSAMRSAFPANDLQKPDYDGHRKEHNRRATDEKVVEGYKQAAIKEFIKTVLAAALGLLVLGFAAWVGAHSK